MIVSQHCITLNYCRYVFFFHKYVFFVCMFFLQHNVLMSHYSPNIRGCEAVVFKTGFLLWKHDGNSSPWGERFLFNKNRLTITTLLRNFSDASTFHWTDFIPVSLSRFMCVSCMYVSCLILVWGWKYRSNLAFFEHCVSWRVLCACFLFVMIFSHGIYICICFGSSTPVE